MSALAAATAAVIFVTIMTERWPFFCFLLLFAPQSSAAAGLGPFGAWLDLLALGAQRPVHRQVVVAFAVAGFAARGFRPAKACLEQLDHDFWALESTSNVRTLGERQLSQHPCLLQT